MAYTIPQIIGWMAICQPLARYGESKKRSLGDTSADPDLDIKLYNTRLDIQYAYDNSADSSILHSIGNYGLALCGAYLFQAQTASGGGTVTPISPNTPIQTIVSPIRITGANFADALSWEGNNGDNINILSSYTLQVYWNDANRFLDEGISWSRTATGFDIIIDGSVITDFDATTTNLTSVFYIYISQ